MKGNELLVAATAALLMTIACGGSTPSPATCAPQASCQKEHSCYDYGGFTAADLAALQDSCQAGAHTWSTAPCDRAGTIGHCDFTRDATCETQWIDPDPLPLSERQLSCTAAGGVWHAP